MPYIYVECGKEHIFRVMKTQQKQSHPPCPYCGSTWQKPSTKEAWIKFRVEFWNKHRKYSRE